MEIWTLVTIVLALVVIINVTMIVLRRLDKRQQRIENMLLRITEKLNEKS